MIAALIVLLIIWTAGCVEEWEVRTPEPETPAETITSTPIPTSSQTATPPLTTEPQTTIFNNEIEIIGDQEFIRQVEAALTLLKDKDPEAFSMVEKYIGRIEQGDHSGMWAYKDPPTFELTDRTAFYSVTWCASVIAHDSYHSKLYHDYRSTHSGSVPDDVWRGVEAERQCIAYQLNVAIKIGAPQREIDYLKSLDGTHGNTPYKERDW